MFGFGLVSAAFMDISKQVFSFSFHNKIDVTNLRSIFRKQENNEGQFLYT